LRRPGWATCANWNGSAAPNRQAILDQFPVWQKVPDEVRADPAATQRFVEAMILLAQVFANTWVAPICFNG